MPDGIVDHPVMAAQHGAIHIHNLARSRRFGAQLADNAGIIAVRHETDVLAVGLVRHAETIFRSQRAGGVLGRQMAQRKAQVIQLLCGG